MRRFNATDAATGARTAAALGRTHSQWHRFTAGAGQTLVVTARAVSFAPLLEIYAPNGEEIEVQNTQTEQGARSRAVFRATQAGVYHVRVSSRGEAQPRSSYAVTVAVARVLFALRPPCAPTFILRAHFYAARKQERQEQHDGGDNRQPAQMKNVE